MVHYCLLIPASMTDYRMTHSSFEGTVISTSVQNIPWLESDHKATPRCKRMMGEMVTFSGGTLSPAENYVTLAWEMDVRGTTGSFWHSTPIWSYESPLQDRLHHIVLPPSCRLAFKSKQFFYKDLTWSILAGDGRLNKAQSFPHVFGWGWWHSKSGIETDDVKRHIVYGRHSPQSLHILQSHRIICWVSSVFSLSQGVMFFIPSLPFGIKDEPWRSEFLSLAPGCCKVFPFKQKTNESGTPRLLFVILCNCLKQALSSLWNEGWAGVWSWGAGPWERRWASCRELLERGGCGGGQGG